MYYVTMQITFPIPECARKERNLHCDVVHVTTKWVSRFVLDRWLLDFICSVILALRIDIVRPGAYSIP